MARLNHGRLSPIQVLDEPKRTTITVQAPVVARGRFYLAGGSALALHLGHRVSNDLDWFTPSGFDAQQLTQVLLSLPTKPTRVEPPQPDTARVYYGELETSFIRYSVVSARPTIVEVEGVKLPVADLETIAVMKAGAVLNRGSKRDLVDIHALVRAPGWSMERFIDVAEKGASIAPGHLRLGLTYFGDADKQEMPAGASVQWDQVKKELLRDVTRAFDMLRERDRRGRGDGGLDR